jgi:hypothetical protein
MNSRGPDDDDDVYLIKLQREVLQNLISTRRMQISQISGISKENTHEKIMKATNLKPISISPAQIP